MLLNDGPTDPGYAAFIQTLRSLPVQQREAIVLNHGEHLNLRYLAVAMDCSIEAATNHLRMATQALETNCGDQTGTSLAAFSRAYRLLSPSLDAARPMIRRQINRYLLPRRLWRTVIAIIGLAVIYGIWRWHGRNHLAYRISIS